MHNYPRNSPEAVARLLALVMIADGNVCGTEIGAVERLSDASLGLPPGGVRGALKTFCEDLLLHGEYSGGSMLSSIDEKLLEALIEDVNDPHLQRKVMAVIDAAVAADGLVSEGEQRVLSALQRCWRTDRFHAVPPTLVN